MNWVSGSVTSCKNRKKWSLHAKMEKSDQPFMCDAISLNALHPHNSPTIIREDHSGPILQFKFKNHPKSAWKQWRRNCNFLPTVFWHQLQNVLWIWGVRLFSSDKKKMGMWRRFILHEDEASFCQCLAGYVRLGLQFCKWLCYTFLQEVCNETVNK